jgi:hypothetical protein
VGPQYQEAGSSDNGQFLSPSQDPNAYQQLIQKAEDFIAQRALRHIGNVTPQPVVHIVKARRDE